MLAAKEKHLAELKRKLGISSLQELKQNIAKGWQDVTATSAYVPLDTMLCPTDIHNTFAPFACGEEEKRGCTYVSGTSLDCEGLFPFSSVAET